MVLRDMFSFWWRAREGNLYTTGSQSLKSWPFILVASSSYAPSLQTLESQKGLSEGCKSAWISQHGRISISPYPETIIHVGSGDITTGLDFTGL